MADKAPIVCCIPRLDPHPKHLEHWQEFYAANKERHNLIPVVQYNRALHHVQRNAVEVAIQAGASHILFTESDQWGYPTDGLDILLAEDKDVIGFRTYDRKYPHQNMCMRKDNPDVSLILPSDEMRAKGGTLTRFGRKRDEPLVQKTDLITWAFTLVKVSVFERMKEAWGNVLVSQDDLKALLRADADTKARLSEYTRKPLGLQPFRQWGPHPTDSFFCQYCEDLGIDRWVHFGHTIGHGDVAPEDIASMRRLVETRKVALTLEPHRVANEDDYGNPYGPDVEHVTENNKVARQMKAQVAA